MKDNVQVNNYGGISFIGALTILVIALKLTGFIDWSWLWVLSPILGVFIFIGIFLFVLFAGLVVDEIKRRKYINDTDEN